MPDFGSTGVLSAVVVLTTIGVATTITRTVTPDAVVTVTPSRRAFPVVYLIA